MKKFLLLLLSTFYFISSSFSGCCGGYDVKKHFVCVYIKNNSHETLTYSRSEDRIDYCQPLDSILFFWMEIDYLEDSLDYSDYYMHRIIDVIEEKNVQIFIGPNEIPTEQLQKRENYKIYERLIGLGYGYRGFALLVTDSLLQQ